jgi:hypothetical protein
MSDLSKWDIAIDFTGEQAAALASGFDPEQPEFVHSSSNPIYVCMKRHYNAAKRLYQEEVQQCDGPPLMDKSEVLESIDLAWGATSEDPENGAYFPKWLHDTQFSGFEAQRFTRKEIARWLSVIGIKSRYQFDLEQSTLIDHEKPFGTVERASLLKLVIGMAIDGYGYDPNAAKSQVPIEIADCLVALGMSMTDDTVRKYLTEAKGLVLPKKPSPT